MENRKRENQKEEDRPTLEEILEFIEDWRSKPEKPLLEENQITTALLMEKTKKSYSWSKKVLKELFDSGLCTREIVHLNAGFIYVYTFETLPEF